MRFAELFLLAVGLSMDTFAISACEGLTMKRVTAGKAVTFGIYFGAFQMGMPIIGYYVSSLFAGFIDAYDHWIALALLCLIGGKMIAEGLRNDGGERRDETSLRPSKMLPLALATSIDALAIGVSFAFLDVQILPASAFIGLTTFTLSVAGVMVGNAFGTRLKFKAEIIGGVILILTGLKIWIEGMFFLTA